MIPLLNFYNKQIKHTWWSPSQAKNVYQKFWNVYSTIIELFSHILLSFDLFDKCTACHSFSLSWDAHCLLNTWGYKSTNTRLGKRTNIPTIVSLFCNNLRKKFGPAKLKNETYNMTIKLTVTCDNFVAGLTQLVSSWLTDSSEIFLLGKLVGHRS